MKKNCLLLLLILMVAFTGCASKSVTNRTEKPVSAESGTSSLVSSEISSAAVSSTPVSNVALGESSVLPQKLQTNLKKSGAFTEGVWIKKYPGDYACFKFETPDGIKIITDPFSMDETVQPDIVTESHQHDDHTNVSKLTKPYELLKTPGVFQVKGIEITGYLGKHNSGKSQEPNIIYSYKINGIRIVHFASQGEIPGEDVLKQVKNADVLLIQVFPETNYNKLTMQDFEKIIKAVNPKIVIPEHGASYISEPLAKLLNVADEYSSSGEIVVTRSALDSIKSPKVIDLDHNMIITN